MSFLPRFTGPRGTPGQERLSEYACHGADISHAGGAGETDGARRGMGDTK